MVLNKIMSCRGSHLGFLIGTIFLCKRPSSRPVIIYIHSFSHVMFLRKIKVIDSLVGYYVIQSLPVVSVTPKKVGSARFAE